MSKIIGHKYEQLACSYLLNQNLQLVHRNFSCKHGEIDLIMLDQDCNADMLVFIEVRYRKNRFYGHPIETVTSRKQARIVRSAWSFISDYPAFKDYPTRFDVLTILGKSVEITKNYDRITGISSKLEAQSPSFSPKSCKLKTPTPDLAINKVDHRHQEYNITRNISQIEWYKNIITDYELWTP